MNYHSAQHLLIVMSIMRVSTEQSSSMSELTIHKIIDTCGTRCPIPLLRAKQALKQMKLGQILQVLASDPSAKPDFDAMLKHLPHELLAYESNVSGEKRVDTFLIVKGE